MTAEPHNSSEDTPPAQDLVRSMQRVGDHLLAGMESDSRVQSGVPGGRLSDDLDFIQMTGLTRPGAPQEPADEIPPAPSPLDPSEPLSFYERGVADVDIALAPQMREGTDDLREVGRPAAPVSAHPRDTYSIEELKQIINELSQGEAAQSTRYPERDSSASAAPDESESPSSDTQPSADASDGEVPPDMMETVLLTKTDSLAELLERELAGQASKDAATAEQDAEPSPVAPDQSPLLEPVQESPETPVLEPIPAETEFDHHEEFASALDELTEVSEALGSATTEEPETLAEELSEAPIHLTPQEWEPSALSTQNVDEAPSAEPPHPDIDAEAPATEPISALTEGLDGADWPSEDSDDEELVEPMLVPSPEELVAPKPFVEDLGGDTAVKDGTAATVDEPSDADTAPLRAPEPAMPYSHDLAEVEQLLRTLQEQPRDTTPSSALATMVPQGASATRFEDDPLSPEPEPSDTTEMFGQEKDESVYRRPQERRRKRKARVHGRLRRRLVRLAVLAALLGVILCAGYMMYNWSRRGLASPGTYLSDAAAQVAKGNYAEAASEYADFVQRNPDHPARADAQFNAAFYLQVMPSDGSESDSSVTGAARLEKSLKLLKQFVEDNPLHAKAARAKTLIGLLDYRLKRYKDAVDQLHSPGLRLEDPYASVVILRTLASSYAHLGDFESARSAYLQAASLPDNYSPDMDYQELSDLCKSMADQAATPEESRRYLEQSAEQLSHAILTPGIDPVTKKRLQSLLAARQSASEAQGAAPAAQTTPPAAAPAAPATAPATPATPDGAQLPVANPPAAPAPETLNAEPDPRLEAEQLNAGAIKPAPAPADSKDVKP